MSQDYRNIPPSGTPLSEKLDYAVNNTLSFGSKVADDFNDLVYIPPDTMATGAAILTGVLIYTLAKKHQWLERFVPGGRSNQAHRFTAWGLNLALAFGVASYANDAVLNMYGVRTPQSESKYTINVEPSLQKRAETPQTPYVPRERQPVNPDKEARVIQINPRVQP